jgi:hypothetical protein
MPCLAAGSDKKVMDNWFALALKPNAKPWLMKLPPNSVLSWRDLCNQFIGAFQGGYKHPRHVNDLHFLPQKTNESLRKYGSAGCSIPSPMQPSPLASPRERIVN